MVLCLLVSTASVARAEDEAPVYAVQNRQYPLGAEFNAAVGTLPMNAYSKGLTLGGGFTWHLSPSWAWEVIQFFYSFSFDTGLKQQLLENFAAQPTSAAFDVVKYLGNTNLTVKPFYGKLAFLNGSILHAEIYFTLGFALANYAVSSFLPGADGGAGIRFFAGRHFSLRVDVRDYAFLKGQVKALSVVNELYIGLGAALVFGGG
jgi:outer membrane beta-barrel protein